MLRVFIGLVALAAIHATLFAGWATGGALTDDVRERLRNRIEAAGEPARLSVADEAIYTSRTLPLFYQRRAYEPAWMNDQGPTARVKELVRAVRRAAREGLRPRDYHVDEIEAILGEVREDLGQKAELDTGRLVDLELLLTDSFLIYGSHLLAGRVDPETIDSEWFANRREVDLAGTLESALRSGRIQESLDALTPAQQAYTRLRRALARYRAVAARGEWERIPAGEKMERGDSGDRVVALRERLRGSGDLEEESGSSREDWPVFDERVEESVKRFQRRHGLEDDGVVGPITLAALNVSLEERIRQIEVNMERWRWLPQNLGERHVLINIAQFELRVFEKSQLVMDMRVVVGRHYRRTPVFSANMTYLVLSPYWNVPPGIAAKDVLPEARRDTGYLRSKNMKVYRGWGAEATEVDPDSVDWSSVAGSNLRYRFRQEPGPSNSLGGIKFMFPNRFDVYLHDTPSRELFAKWERAFSSGCIRIEKPLDLAEYVLRGHPDWSREKIVAAIERRVERTVRLPEPIAVHLLYWTAWAEEDGAVSFRRDIYDRDKLVEAALREAPPAPDVR